MKEIRGGCGPGINHFLKASGEHENPWALPSTPCLGKIEAEDLPTSGCVVTSGCGGGRVPLEAGLSLKVHLGEGRPCRS